jgi:hypothetical protein
VSDAGPGPLGQKQNGYAIESDGGSGTIEFMLANAYSNTDDGFSIVSPSSLASAKFLRSESGGNGGDGFDVNGGQIEVLCSAARNNSIAGENQGRGIVVSVSATQLHIENTHVVDNEGVGIHGGNSNLRVISSTVIDNDLALHGEQIQGSNVSVFTTIGRGKDFVAGDNPSVCGVAGVWGGNLCKSTDMATSCCAGTNPCCAEANVLFSSSSSRTFLADGSPGLDSSSGNPAIFASSLVRIADDQDYFGTTRAQDGDNNGSSLHDVGAFERLPPPPVSTPTRTRTPTITKTPSRTLTRTPRPTRTPVPPTPTPPGCSGTDCQPPCVGDCDCSGGVLINELVFAVNHLFGASSSCPGCFDGNDNGVVTVEEVVLSVKHAIAGCPASDGGGGQGENGPTVTVDVGTASGPPGAAVQLPISISGGGGLVAGVQVDLLYDIDDLDPYFDCVLSARLGSRTVAAEFVSVPAPPAGMRRLRVVVLPSFSSIAPFTDGEVAVCTFDISGSAVPGAIAVQAAVTGASDANGIPFPTVGDAGSITVCGGCGCP